MNAATPVPSASAESPGDLFARLFPRIDSWDRSTLERVHHNATGKWMATGAVWISFCGDPRLWIAALIVFGIIGLVASDLTLVILFGTGFVQSFAVYYVIKHIFRRQRPFLQVEGVSRRDKTGHGYSFPSGHCHHSTILLGLLWLQFFPTPYFILVLIAYNIILGYSRVVSGVHFPSDIIIGVAEAYVALAIHWLITKAWYLAIYAVMLKFVT